MDEKGIYLSGCSENKIYGNTITPSENGIYFNQSTRHIFFENCYTICDVCGEQIAEKYFVEGENEEFPRIKEKTKWKNEKKITIVGVCEKCLEK